MTPEDSAIKLIRNLASGNAIRYGDPLSFSGLSLTPVFTANPAPFAYALLAGAVAAATVVIQEVGGGSVPSLRLVNKGALPVLLVDGEHLVGVKQNRILNTTILVPEKSTLDVPVSCVEAGRWSAPVHEARPVSPALFASARARQTEQVTASVRTSGRRAADQQQVWDGVAAMISDLGASSPTSAMQEAYTQRGAEFGDYVKHLPVQPGQTGVVASVRGRVVCADLFDRHETLAGLWERLVPSYAVEAIAAGRRAPGISTPEISPADAAAFVRSVVDATMTEHPAVGRGTEVRITGEVFTGAALEAERAILHLALFPTEGHTGMSSDARFASVSERRRRKQ
jgi:hypothetical protein